MAAENQTTPEIINVLAIDADPGFEAELRAALPPETGFVISFAADALAARKRLEGAGLFGLCLVSTPLSGLEEPEFIGWIANNLPFLPVVLVKSGPVSDEFLCRCLTAGASDCLNKPFVPATAARLLTRIVARRNLKRPVTDLIARSPAGGWVEITAPSELEYLIRMRQFSETLFGSRLPREICEDLRLAIDEAGRNAIEWGNRFDAAKLVRISYCLFDDRIVFKFEDEGEGFNPEKISNPTIDPRAHLENRKALGKRPGGYGVFLLQQLMDEVIYSEKGSTVVLTRYFERP